MIKILHVLSSLDGGGVEAMLKNYYNFMNKDKYHFDFIVHSDNIGILEEEFKKSNSKIFHVTNKHKSIIKNFKEINEIVKNGHYDIIHCHQNEMSFIPLIIAKHHKVKMRIMHSHNSIVKEKFITKLQKNIFSFIGRKCSTHLMACTNSAGLWLFGNSFKNNGTVLYNAINIDKFKYNEKSRNKYRKEYNLENCFVLGNIGRMSFQKNHEFLIDIFNEVLKIKKNARLVLIGDGELKEDIKKQVKKYRISDKVIFLGVRNDVNNLINMFDTFVFPTRYEGLGIVIVEAQANGLPIYMSDVVPKEATIIHQLINEISLLTPAKEWAKLICSCNCQRKENSNEIQKACYDIRTEAKKLELFYSKEYSNEK